MKVIYNSLIPFKGFTAVNLFGAVFARKGAPLSDATLNHEAIHTAQMRELGFVPFYVIYLFEWLARLLLDYSSAYRSVSFEREAYEHQGEADYLSTRRHFAQWRKS